MSNRNMLATRCCSGEGGGEEKLMRPKGAEVGGEKGSRCKDWGWWSWSQAKEQREEGERRRGERRRVRIRRRRGW